nr:hypothetical protein [Pedobacter panaciterrae]
MGKLEVNVSMYPVGELGDCFLLKFSQDDAHCSVLIDSGSFSNSKASIARLRVIAEDIKQKQTLVGKVNPIDVVVGTHQHNDHLSNFVHSKDIFKEIGMKNVWLSWLDEPGNEHADNIAKGERKLVNKLEEINAKISKITNLKKGQTAQRINEILGFYGLDKQPKQNPVIPQYALNNLKEIAEAISYLTPGKVLSLPSFPEDAVKIYVLGPPTDNDMLFDINPGKGESYDEKLKTAINGTDAFLSALTNFSDCPCDEESYFPFNERYKMDPTEHAGAIGSYNLKGQEWRKIDDDWLEQAERLALYLDTYTNNSSLVLAFEMVQAEKVLLFVGDAQTGNWLSWKKVDFGAGNTSVSNLLARTVLYKVGHHCSHNATLPECLEKMTHPELVAMIPVDITDSHISRKNGWKMPSANLYKRIKELANGRILRMDGNYQSDCPIEGGHADTNWGAMLSHVNMEKIAGLNNEIVTYKIY